MARKAPATKARVAKNFSTGGIPGVSGTGSNFQLGKSGQLANGGGPGAAAGSSAYPAGKGAIGNSGGIPAGAK